ncbi:MAG: DUF4340 domain-containing protein [Planctomycetaceae bacterium]|jgi:hypothetical protein|nr:DUF4340 domain-containing protein [Planctomycetaceae bacterium]
MTETTKTCIFALLAAVFITGAVLSRPGVHEIKMEEMVGKALFPKFTDPLGVKTLEIVKLDPDGERSEFKIAEVNGIWSIPSHENYPADGKDQMGKAAEALVDLNVLEVISAGENHADVSGFLAKYGVLDPSAGNVSTPEGAGLKVTLGGGNNEPLVDLIIGKEAETAANPQEMPAGTAAKLRYVRVAGQTPVYVVRIDPARFPMNFDRWIEKNLLDISTFDIKEIFVDEYSLESDGRSLMPGFIGDFTLKYDPSSAAGDKKWSLLKLARFTGKNADKYTEQPLEPGKELDTQTLDDAVSALNDLKIAGIKRKPAKIASALRDGSPFEKIEMESTAQIGFYLVEMPDLKRGTKKRKVQLLANQGDMQLRLQNGIVYALRFGDLTGTESEIAAEKKPEEEKTETDGEKKEPVMGMNRYLFITAEFDPSILPPPELKTVAEGGTAEEKEAAEKANQREKERYETDLESGKKRAAELSRRFADWYYVIPEDVYKKIHLTSAKVFRTKAEGAEAAEPETPDASRPSLPDLPGLPAEQPAPAEPAATPAEQPAPAEPAATPH